MEPLRVRKNVIGYKRDSYLGAQSEKPVLSPTHTKIDCEVGNAQWGISPRAIEAHRAFDPQRLATYPELFHETLLKPAILERFSVAGLEPSQLFFGHGSFNLAERLIHKCVEPEIMLGVGPQFNEIPTEFVAAGGRYETINVQPPNYEFLSAPLLDRLARGDVSVVYLDNPNNPLGSQIALSILAEITARASPHGTIVIVDEAYGDFLTEDHSAAHLVPRYRNLAVLRSLSKGLGLAAERVGYMFLSQELADIYKPLDVPFEPTLYAATLACAVTKDVAFTNHVRRVVTHIKVQIIHALKEANFTILPTHPAVPIMTIHRPDGNAVAELASIGVSVEPGIAFRETHSGWTNAYCRIRVPSEDRVDELCERIATLRR